VAVRRSTTPWPMGKYRYLIHLQTSMVYDYLGMIMIILIILHSTPTAAKGTIGHYGPKVLLFWAKSDLLSWFRAILTYLNKALDNTYLTTYLHQLQGISLKTHPPAARPAALL
jgi:hypothetical protein